MKLLATLTFLLLLPQFFFAQSSDLSPYTFDGHFQEQNPSFPFRGNPIANIQVMEDRAQNLQLSDFLREPEQFEWVDGWDFTPEYDKIYWLKTTLQGSSVFNGDIWLHLAPEAGNANYGFGYVDYYLTDGHGLRMQHRTGHAIAMVDRPFEFWAPFITINLQPDDSLDLYLRLEKMDRYYPLPFFGLWHIDQASVFPRQLKEARSKILFFGVLVIQFLFFACLFLIEKEKIHIYFSLLILGLFLLFAFIPNNYYTYVPFPNWKAYHFLLYFLGNFLSKFGLLKFVETYFNYKPASVWSKRVIPGFILFFVLIDGFTFVKISLGSFVHHTALFTFSAICSTLVFIPFFAMALMAKRQKRALKQLFFIAFTPLSILAFLLLNWEYLFPYLETKLEGNLMYYLLRLRNSAMMSIVFMLGVLALSIGYRTRFLKAEKEKERKQKLNTQKTLLENQLEAEKLQELTELKNRFFTNITHEFRTPLTVIMGLNDDLARRSRQLTITKEEKQKIQRGHELVHRNSTNLLHLVNQLLDLSRADSKLLRLDLKQGDIIPFLNYLTESFYSLAKEKNIRLVFYPEVDTLLMDFDESKIQQVIYNLISNALKFTDSGGKVVIHARCETKNDQPYLNLKIKDSGRGVPPDELDNIFDRYYQTSASSNQIIEGTGIGLALTKELVQLMNGHISVKSELGKGTVFTVELPLTTKTPLSDKDWSKAKLSTIPLTTDIKTKPTDPVLSESAPLILLVEDNMDIIHYVSQLLSDQYHIQSANDGTAGIKKAFDLIPDIIISDVMMPGQDGFTLTEILKKDPRTSHIPIILLTAKATWEDKLEGLKKGADAYLMKPFNKTELFIRIENLLESRRLLQQKYAANKEKVTIGRASAVEEELNLDDLFLEKLTNYVLTHIKGSSLTVDKLAKEVNLSNSQLNRKLKALTGETPNGFIRSIRLQKAMELLTTTDYQIAEIAYKVGFNDPNYFTRVFTKAFNQIPSTFRKDQ